MAAQNKMVVGLIVVLVAAVGFTNGNGGVDREAERAWAAAFPKLPVPASVLLEESPLSSTEAALWAKIMSGNQHSTGGDLCSEGRLLCSRELRLSVDVPKSKFKFDIIYWDANYMAANHMAAGSVEHGHFFRLHQMFVGASMAFPNLNHPIPSHPYLPHMVAQHLSLKPQALPHLLATFGIPESSPMAASMLDTSERCNRPPADNSSMACVTSIEDMLRFVIITLGSSVDFLESDASPNFLTNYTLATITSLVERTPLKETYSNVVCHKMMFPSMVRLCHELQFTKVYEAEMRYSEQARPIDAVAICHFDTSKWDANHPSFFVLGISPGQGEVCHWVLADEHVWVHV